MLGQLRWFFQSPPDAVLSLIGFFCSLWLFPLVLALLFLGYSASIVVSVVCLYFILSILIVLFVTCFYDRSEHVMRPKCDPWQNVFHAYGLGCVFSLGVFLIFIGDSLKFTYSLKHFGTYLVFLSFFHWSEFYVTALFNPSHVWIDTYMINHSPAYVLAMAASVCEYWIETFLVLNLGKSVLTTPLCLRFLGFLFCFCGEVLRKGAIITAGENFNHYVETSPRDNHELVTHGVYAWFRHPAYVGWFLWALGTQLLLGNPICLLVFTVTAYTFFADRIAYEEHHLVRFFGVRYREYQTRVGVGIPFIRGYQ